MPRPHPAPTGPDGSHRSPGETSAPPAFPAPSLPPSGRSGRPQSAHLKFSPVHSRRSLISPDFLVRLPHMPLRNTERLFLRPRLAHSIPPRDSWLPERTSPRTVRLLRSTPITEASSLL